MRKISTTFKISIFSCLLAFSFSLAVGQATSMDLQKAKTIIDGLDKKFSADFFNADSVALFNAYAKDGRCESFSGKELFAFWGTRIRNSIKFDTRTLSLAATSLSTDGEFITELGTAVVKNGAGETVFKGKFLVVWKLENEQWKIYRDIEL